MINKPQLSIKNLSEDKINALNIWTRREGWNPGIYDLNIFFRHQPNAFYGGFLNNELICTASAYQYNDDYVFLGFYIVHPNYRNQGYGIEFANYLNNIVKNTTIEMDGVLNMVTAYETMGFKNKYLTTRYRFKNLINHKNLNPDIHNLSQGLSHQLIEYSEKCQSYVNNALLLDFIQQPHCVTKIYKKNDKIYGYGVIRQSYEGFRIGPLLADSVEIGIAIIRELITNTQGINIDIDLSDYNDFYKVLVQEFDMKKIFSTQRMYKNKIQNKFFSGIYAPMSLEIG